MLLVEDDLRMAAAIRRGLRAEGIVADIAPSGLDALGMAAVIAIGCIGHITAGVANSCRNHTGLTANELLHTPKTAACKYRAFLAH